jgi:HEAT repeat protein
MALGAMLARDNRQTANAWVTEIAKRDLELRDVMMLLSRSTPRGLGVGPEPRHGSIERLLLGLENKAPLDLSNLDRDALKEAAFQTAAVAKVVAKMKSPSSEGKEAWKKNTKEFVFLSFHFADAVESRETKEIEAAVKRLNNACAACHYEFRKSDDVVEEKIGTLLARVAKRPPSSLFTFPDDRVSAIRALEHRHSDANRIVPCLIEVLRTPEADVRAEAIRVLGVFGRKGVSSDKALDALLQKETVYYRYWIVHHAGDEATGVEALTAGLKATDPAIRTRSLELLGGLGEAARPAATAIEQLQENDSETEVRLAATRALQQVERSGGIPPLLKALKDPDPLVRGRAAIALGKLGKAAVPGLREVLKIGDRDVRASVIGALGRIGADARDAVPELSALAQDDDPLLRTLASDALRKIDPQ